jgi:hypothetical protein
MTCVQNSINVQEMHHAIEIPNLLCDGEVEVAQDY